MSSISSRFLASADFCAAFATSLFETTSEDPTLCLMPPNRALRAPPVDTFSLNDSILVFSLCTIYLCSNQLTTASAALLVLGEAQARV